MSKSPSVIFASRCLKVCLSIRSAIPRRAENRYWKYSASREVNGLSPVSHTSGGIVPPSSCFASSSSRRAASRSGRTGSTGYSLRNGRSTPGTHCGMSLTPGRVPGIPITFETYSFGSKTSWIALRRW